MPGSSARLLVGMLLDPRAGAPVGMLCLGLLAGGCSGGRAAAPSEASPDIRIQTALSGAPRASLPSSPVESAMTPKPSVDGPAPAELFWLEGGHAHGAVSTSPWLNPMICRMREEARRQVLGRGYQVGEHGLGCASFESGWSPASHSKPADEAIAPSELHQEPDRPAQGRFVPIEPESALGHFHRALARLSEGHDEDGKVRILAYGASHTQADAYPGYLRAYFQRRFGNGGRGFVPLGRINAWYGTLDTRVQDRALTVQHARSAENAEGMPLGLFGAALIGASSDAFGEITTALDSPNTQFEVHYWKEPRGGDFGLYLDGKRLAVISTKAKEPGPGSYRFEAPAGQRSIRAQLRGNGQVRLFGVVAETATPGVVVDTLGIGGSRMDGNLRWHEDGWIEAVRHRQPDLVTFAYGTNEATDKHLSIASYSKRVRAVLERMRKALPEVSCVLIAPFDLPALSHSRLLAILDAQRRISQEFGCGFWDAYGFMGGSGSIRRWASADPPLASSDHIHLTRRGYVYAGMAIGDALMRAHDLDPIASLVRWPSP